MKSYFINHKTVKLLPIAISCLLFSSTLYASVKKDNLKGYQATMVCTLPQEIFKDATLEAMDITYMKPNIESKKASTSLQKALNTLKKEKHSSALHKDILSLSSAWKKTKRDIDTKLSKDSIKLIYKSILSIDESCLSIAKRLSTNNKNLMKDRVAKLNLYTQQLTTLYIIKAWNSIDDKSYQSSVNKMIISYEDNYNTLYKNKTISAKVKAKLEEINKAFTTFKFMTTSTSGRYMPVLAAKKASKINMLTQTILEGK